MNSGDTVYFIENNMHIQEGTVVNSSCDFVLIKYGSGAGIRLRKSKVYTSEEEAKTKLNIGNRWKRKSPYDYEH